MPDLAGPNDPLILRDGKRIDVTTGRAVRQSSGVPRTPAVFSDSRSATSPARRRIEDLAIEPPLLSSILVVAAFKLCNFDPLDIQLALGTSPEMMTAVESHSKFQEVYNMLVESVQSAAFTDAESILLMNAPKAAEALVDNLDEDDPILRMSAADKVLERAGVGRKGDGVTGQGFRIEIYEKTADKDASISIKVGV